LPEHLALTGIEKGAATSRQCGVVPVLIEGRRITPA